MGPGPASVLGVRAVPVQCGVQGLPPDAELPGHRRLGNAADDEPACSEELSVSELRLAVAGIFGLGDAFGQALPDRRPPQTGLRLRGS